MELMSLGRRKVPIAPGKGKGNLCAPQVQLGSALGAFQGTRVRVPGPQCGS
jgi:hypothetical protein